MKGLLLTWECGMTMVWGDPAGFAVDWDWQRGLTVWELAGQYGVFGAGGAVAGQVREDRLQQWRLGVGEHADADVIRQFRENHCHGRVMAGARPLPRAGHHREQGRGMGFQWAARWRST
jgi:hypothetical protein